MNSEEIKNEFINCIEGTHTLNLAVSILEERDLYHSIIKEVREYIDYYGITPEQNDDVMVRHILKGILEILDKVGDEV